MSFHWQQKKSQPSHADDWLMTYADMITLLLCFFVVLLMMTMAKKELLHKTPAPQAVAQVETAPQPVVTPQPLLQDLPLQNLHEPAPGNYAPAGTDPIELPVATTVAKAATADASVAIDTTTTDSAPAAPAPEAAPAAVTDAPILPFTPIPPAIDLPPVTNDALPGSNRITTFTIDSAAFFYSGAATLSAGGMDILRKVAAELKDERFKDYQITVEGHTDDTPIHTAQFPSNWELSTARASAVVHFLLDQGIPAGKLRAAGYADTFPLAPNRDAAGNPLPANQAKNRRVVIKLEKIDPAQ